MASDSPPLPKSYWVTESLLAGEYPGAIDKTEALEKLRCILEAGVSCFVDLTEAGENGLNSYESLLQEQSSEMEVASTYTRRPVEDLDIPSRAEMVDILDFIDEKVRAGQKVYVHCRGGIGRTGTVVGCYLARHGFASGVETLTTIATLRESMPLRGPASPETYAQRNMVTSWRESE